MYRQSVDPIISRTLATALLGCLGARPAAALLVTPTLHLFTAMTGLPTIDTVAGAFTEATFNGYASQTPIGFGAPSVLLPSGQGLGNTSPGWFFAAGSGLVIPGETVLGYWIDDGAAAMYLIEVFDSPVPFAAFGDFLVLDLTFPLITPGQVA